MSVLAQFALVFVGGAIGGAARHSISGLVARRAGETFPWGTLVVNVSGALLIGVLAGVAGAGGSPLADGPPSGAGLGASGWVFVVVGILGSYTTVSSFSLQTLELVRGGEARRAASNVLLSFVLCLAAAAAGFLGAGAVVVG